MLTLFSLEWINFLTHQETTRVCSYIGMSGVILQLHLSVNLGWNMVFLGETLATGFTILVVSAIAVLIVLTITISVARHRQQWFLIDSARLNPYKLVYRVTKFARQHKVPIQLSAFTYCEDDVPSGLDPGKDKYGGPFTTEQVEDVKAFYGILKILFATGTTFFLQISTDRFLFLYSKSLHFQIPFMFTAPETMDYLNLTDIDTGGIIKRDSISLLLHFGLLTPLLLMVSIPAFIFFFRPCTNYHQPRMLKRIGFGILLMLTSATCTMFIDSKGIWNCIFNHRFVIYYDSLVCLAQRSLCALSNILIYPALYEFICAQSPHSMKGLLMGLLFAIRGLFELCAVFTVIILIYIREFYNSCAIDYYLLNMILGIIGLLAYIYVAKRYKLRERNEPCHVRQYVEDYYSKIQKERHYDYSASIKHQ